MTVNAELVLLVLMTLNEYLIANGKSREAFAAEIGVSTTTVCRYILGQRYPKREILQRIRAHTSNRVTADDFLQADENLNEGQPPAVPQPG